MDNEYEKEEEKYQFLRSGEDYLYDGNENSRNNLSG